MKTHAHLCPSRPQRGGALLESLISMLIVAFGVLGFVGLQAKTAVVNLEGYQRAQALVLVNDLAQRINANRTNAAAYVTNTTNVPYVSESFYVGESDPGTCGGTRAQIDLCEWTKLLRGAAEGSTTGAVNKARGCVQQVGTDFLVAVFWEGYQGSGRSAVHCGSWDAVAGTGTSGPAMSATLLRGVSALVRIGVLS